MTSGTSRVSPWQITVLVFTLSLCMTPLDLPALLLPHLGPRNAWWGTLPALPIGLWGTAAAAALGRRFPGRALDRTAVAVLGPAAGYPYLVALIALFLFSTPACLLVFAPAAQGALLPRLPAAFVAIMVAATGTYAARSGPESVARSAEAFVPFLGAGLLAVYIPLLFTTHFGRLLPVRVPAWPTWWSGPVLGASGTIRGFLPLLVLGPLAARPTSGRPVVAASIAAWVLILASVVFPVAIFDAPLVQRFAFPFLSAEDSIGWRFLPLRSFISLTLVVWYVVTFVVFSTYLWMAAWLLRRLVPALPRRGPVEVLGAAAALVASIPFSEHTFHVMFITWDIAVVILGVLVPTLMVILSRRQDTVRGQARREGRAA